MARGKWKTNNKVEEKKPEITEINLDIPKEEKLFTEINLDARQSLEYLVTFKSTNKALPHLNFCHKNGVTQLIKNNETVILPREEAEELQKGYPQFILITEKT